MSCRRVSQEGQQEKARDGKAAALQRKHTHKLELARPGVDGGVRVSPDAPHHVVDAPGLEPCDGLFVKDEGGTPETWGRGDGARVQ